MATEKTLDFQKRKISYKVQGKGPTVVLVHGMPFDGNLWMPLLALPSAENAQPSLSEDSSMSDKFKFIIPDLPGSGASEMIDDMSMEGMAEVIKSIIDVENANDFLVAGNASNHSVSNPEAGAMVVPTDRRDRKGVLIGHSIGGYISLAFAEKYPEYLKGVGLFHSTAYPDSEERRTNRKKAIDSVKNDGVRSFLKTMIPNLFSPNSKEKMPNTIDEFITRTTNFSADTFVSYYEAMMQRPDRTSALKNLKIPMLIIAGKYDNAAPLNDLLKLCHLPEISYFHILSESGHMGMIEEVEKSNRILNDYLTNLS
jgi:pimeloyl-ACP methyl ester carboxylesterase